MAPSGAIFYGIFYHSYVMRNILIKFSWRDGNPEVQQRHRYLGADHGPVQAENHPHRRL